MASRINTKFAFTLAVIVMTVTVILGGLGFLAYRATTQRHITAGDELMAKGEYIQALKEYGRAVDKEKSDLSYLAKYEEALMNIRPATPSQAGENYAKYLGVFTHKIRYQPGASDIHLDYLKELYSRARLIDYPSMWGDLYRAANEMKSGVPQSDPNHVFADLYMGISITRKSSIPTIEESQEAQEHLSTFIKAVPDSDKGWAGRVQVLLSESYRKRAAGNNVLAQELFDEADEYLRQAREAVPDGAQVAKLTAARLLQRKAAGENTITDQEVALAIDKMVDLATASSDPLHLLDIANTIRHMDRVQGIDRGINILQTYVADNPLSHLHKFSLAELLLLADRYEESNKLSNEIINAEPVVVSLLSRYLPILRIRAASLVVDCEFEQWEKSSEQERKSKLESMKQARERLAVHVPNPTKEPFLLRVDGKIAYAQGNLHEAAEKFEQCLSLMNAKDYEILLYSSQVLEQIGQEGTAIERIDDALKEKQGNLYLLRKKAQLQLKLMRFEEAFETISEALRRDQDDSQTQMLAQIIDDARKQNIGGDVNDITLAVNEARDAIDEGNHDNARSILLSAIEKNGEDDVRLLYILAVIELQQEQLDLASDYLDRALKLQPGNQNLQVLKSTIGISDPLERFKLAVKIAYPTDPQQTVMLAVELLRRANQLDKQIEQFKANGNDEGAQALTEQADRARTEGQTLLAHANEISPDHRAVLDYLLTQSLMIKDWEAAGKIVERAKASNADQAQGLLFQGRYELSREQFEQAVQTLTLATERKPYESHPWRLLGRAYESVGNNSQAQQSYAEAYERDPNDMVVVDWYVSLLERMGENVRALRVMRTSQSLMDRSQSLKNRWLRLEASDGDLPLAIRERREVYKRNPKYWPNAMQLASLLVQTEPTHEHILDEDGKQLYVMDRWVRFNNEQRTQMLQNVAGQWLDESDKIVDALEVERGDVLEIAFLRATMLKAQGRIEEGDNILLDYLQKHDESERTIQMYIALGEYRIATDQITKAASILNEGKEYQSAIDREADTTLANLYYSKQGYKLAADLYVELIKAKPDKSTSLRLVECYINLKELEKASDLLKDITEQEGSDLYSIMLASSIKGLEADEAFTTEGEIVAHSLYVQQRSILDDALILYPGDPRPYIQQARSYLNEFRHTNKGALLSDASLTLNEADEMRAGTIATSYVRTEVLLAMGDTNGAIGELSRLLKQAPDDVRARSTLIRLYESQGNFGAALSLVDEAIERNPILTGWHTKKGDLHVKLNNLEAAALAYNEAYRQKPSPNRLLKVTEVSLRVSNPEYAGIVTFFNSAGSRFLEGDIKLRSLNARALYGNGQLDDALEQLRIGYNEFASSTTDTLSDLNSLDLWFMAINIILGKEGPTAFEQFINEVTNNDPSAYCLDWTARAWHNLGDEGRSRAIELQQLAISKCPDDKNNLRAILYVNLGTYNLAGMNYVAADSAFTEALQYNPNHFIALNNAAYVKSLFLNKAADALPLAQKASSFRPNDPSVLDTLGWCYYLVGQYDEAENILRKSVKLRELSGNVYHLANVFFKQGRLDAAQTRLNRAAELNPDPDTDADIKRLLDDIAKAKNR